MGPALVEILGRTTDFLKSRGVDAPRLDAELILAHVLGMERLALYLQFDRPLTDDELDRLRPLVRRRGQREPMAWILGERGFHALDLVVHTGVLVPRPDTETLVEAALERIRAVPGEDPVYIADLGCGTGAVGLAIAHAEPRVRVYAVDLSPEALANTRENVERLGLSDRVGVIRGDLLDAVPGHRPVDWIVSNPPYIPTGDIDALMPEVSRFEPRLALDGGPDGLDVVRRIVDQTMARVRHGVLLEIGHDQAEAVAEVGRSAGLVDVTVHNDLANIGRVVSGIKAASAP